MLMIGGKTDKGHTIHLIVGPESEFYMDIHGTQSIDITQLLMAMNGTRKVVLELTRCKSEVQTAQQMTASDIPHLNSFVPSRPVKHTDGPDLDTILGTPIDAPVSSSTPVQKPIKVRATKPIVGRCSYCGTVDSPLVDVPNFRICRSCIQIELGKSRAQSDRQVAAEADKVRGE
jgi:hypothetical protein